MKQFQMEIFFASIIEMLCDGEFEGLNIHFRKGIIFVNIQFYNRHYYIFVVDKSFFS